MSTRNALVLAVVICGLLALGFAAGRTAERIPAPPYTVTPSPGGQFLVTDSQSGLIRVMTLGHESAPGGVPKGPRVSDNGYWLALLAQFDITQFPVAAKADEAAPSTPAGTP